MFKIGCAEEELKVPLFAELYGYGHYAARRNTGVHEPLYCRAFSFNDGVRRAMIVSSDLCCTDDQFARELRARIATKLRINPEGIAFAATHTHSGPALYAESPDTSGIRNAEFRLCWETTVMRVALAAFLDEEEIGSADAGRAPLEKPIGKNRVEPEKNITDPAIRWVRFRRPDGSVKLLIHNHGVHGIADSGPLYYKVSSDWMGTANRLIREQGLAGYALFLQGPAGDINTRTTCAAEKKETVGAELGSEYVRYLAAGLSDGKALPLGEIGFALKTFEFPVVRQTPEELRADADSFRARGRNDRERDYWAVNAQRLDEMALLTEKGFDLGSCHDLQVIQLGGSEIFFIPGELYIEPGMALLEKAGGAGFPLAATVSNGSGQYFFTEKSGLRYPRASSTAEKLFGYYEIYGYMHQLRFRYRNDIASFVVDNLLALEKALKS